MFTKKRIGCLLISLLLGVALLATPFSVLAETVPMTWNAGEKAYISIIIDDNNTELRRMYDLITGEYGFPLCVAVPVRSYDTALYHGANPSSLTLLHEIENHGGEILSHTLTHKVFNSSVSWADVDYELGESYRRLTAEGFNVNGVILAGGGGTEDTSEAYRAQVEQYTSKYYKYSDYYGVSTQYYHPRKWMYNGYRRMKTAIDTAITNKSWDVIAAHGISAEIASNTEQNVRMILDYLKKKEEEGVLEVVTYKEAHEKYATWSGNVEFGDTKYTVDFYDFDNNTLLKSQVVTEGQGATAPAFEAPQGMKFDGWSASFDNITDNLRVYAQCSQNTITTTVTVEPSVPLTTIVTEQPTTVNTTVVQTGVTVQHTTTLATTTLPQTIPTNPLPIVTTPIHSQTTVTTETSVFTEPSLPQTTAPTDPLPIVTVPSNPLTTVTTEISVSTAVSLSQTISTEPTPTTMVVSQTEPVIDATTVSATATVASQTNSTPKTSVWPFVLWIGGSLLLVGLSAVIFILWKKKSTMDTN